MSKECLGCGSILQSENAKNEGFVKSSVYDKAEYCERCFKIKHYGEYSVLDKKIDTDGIIRNINSDNLASVAFLIDGLNINENVKKYIDSFLKKIEVDNVKRLYIVGFTNSGKSTFINHLLTSVCKNPTITTSSVPNTTASYITIKLNPRLVIVDTPGFIDNNAIYNFIDYSKVVKLYPKKELKVKTFQVRNSYAIVVNDILRIENIAEKYNSFSFYMNDSLRYEKVKSKNDKLTILQSVIYDIKEPSDILINGLGFIRVTKPGKIKVYALDIKLVSIRKSMI